SPMTPTGWPTCSAPMSGTRCRPSPAGSADGRPFSTTTSAAPSPARTRRCRPRPTATRPWPCTRVMTGARSGHTASTWSSRQPARSPVSSSSSTRRCSPRSAWRPRCPGVPREPSPDQGRPLLVFVAGRRERVLLGRLAELALVDLAEELGALLLVHLVQPRVLRVRRRVGRGRHLVGVVGVEARRDAFLFGELGQLVVVKALRRTAVLAPGPVELRGELVLVRVLFPSCHHGLPHSSSALLITPACHDRGRPNRAPVASGLPEADPQAGAAEHPDEPHDGGGGARGHTGDGHHGGKQE